MQVNNAGHSGVVMDVEGLKALNIDPERVRLTSFII